MPGWMSHLKIWPASSSIHHRELDFRRSTPPSTTNTTIDDIVTIIFSNNFWNIDLETTIDLESDLLNMTSYLNTFSTSQRHTSATVGSVSASSCSSTSSVFASFVVDPKFEEEHFDGFALTTNGSEEFSPFVRRLPEFKLCVTQEGQKRWLMMHHLLQVESSLFSAPKSAPLTTTTPLLDTNRVIQQRIDVTQSYITKEGDEKENPVKNMGFRRFEKVEVVWTRVQQVVPRVEPGGAVVLMVRRG
ncbi:unnamed protein product [Lactuca virosa]|uniref:Uncharacterized protein n=1 Tax=Lactuca virosa TaxID=75947 RepID=A0AAU9NJT6_9ASTR|nr:unnamed protein product [Lactuca virosa]